MRMERPRPVIARSRLAAPIVTTLIFLAAPLVVCADEGGKQAFVDSRCDRCHGVITEGIEPKKPRASDLSHAGAKRDVAWIRAYVLRKELIAGNPHPVAWKGSDAELETLVAWLASLK